MKTNKKKMFFPAVKKGTIDSYIIFPRCPLIFLPVAEKGTIKSGRNQDEKTKVSGENFYNYLSYNILHHLNEIYG